MHTTTTPQAIIGWLFAFVLCVIGALNLWLIHPVPGIVYFLLSLLYIPPTNDALKKRFGFAIPAIVKIILGVVVIWFTLGVSDLGDRYL